MKAHTGAGRCRVVVLISGTGTNLQALIDANSRRNIDIDLTAVISDQSAAAGLARARRAGIAAYTVEQSDFPDKTAFFAALTALVAENRPELIVLAGFMRILPASFVRRYSDCILNIHPALLPDYKGLHTHARVVEAGETAHGATVHFVTEALDAGPSIIQYAIDVLPDDTAETLSARIQEGEHKIYPLVVGWYAEGRLRMLEGKAMLDNRPLTMPVMWSVVEETTS